jgi:hypothetical protein
MGSALAGVSAMTPRDDLHDRIADALRLRSSTGVSFSELADAILAAIPGLVDASNARDDFEECLIERGYGPRIAARFADELGDTMTRDGIIDATNPRENIASIIARSHGRNSVSMRDRSWADEAIKALENAGLTIQDTLHAEVGWRNGNIVDIVPPPYYRVANGTPVMILPVPAGAE